MEIKQPNKMFVVRGKPIRTPLIIDNVTEQELTLFKSKIQLEAIQESMYSIIPMDQLSKHSRDEQKIDSVNSNKEDKVYDLDDEEEPFLDSFLDEE